MPAFLLGGLVGAAVTLAAVAAAITYLAVTDDETIPYHPDQPIPYHLRGA